MLKFSLLYLQQIYDLSNWVDGGPLDKTLVTQVWILGVYVKSNPELPKICSFTPFLLTPYTNFLLKL